MRVVLIGASGQLGTDLRWAAPEFPAIELVALKHEDLDVVDHEAAARKLEELRPDAVINTAAFHKVEACEEDPEQAFAVNCHAVRNLALTCDRIGAHLVHMSTDYVFGGDGEVELTEDRPVAPLNVYGASKAAGEMLIRAYGRRYTIARVSGLFGVAGASGKGGNFVETMLRIGGEKGQVAVVTDQRLSPTSTADLARTVLRVVENRVTGTLHITNAGDCTWNEFASEIFSVAGMRVEVLPNSSATSVVRRPAYSVLRDTRLGALGLAMRPRIKALADYMLARERRNALV